MIGLLQRVSSAKITIVYKTVAEMSRGVLVFVGIERDDDEAKADRLLGRLISYRIFPDEAGRMNLSLLDIQGDLLLVPQFTLAADTRKGSRPGFSSAASPEDGRRLFDYLCNRAAEVYPRVSTGIFGADMPIALVNDGPVTFWLQV